MVLLSPVVDAIVADLCKSLDNFVVGVEGPALVSSSVVPTSSSSYRSFWYRAYLRRAIPSRKRFVPTRATVGGCESGAPPSNVAGVLGVRGVWGSSSTGWVWSLRLIWSSTRVFAVLPRRMPKFDIDIGLWAVLLAECHAASIGKRLSAYYAWLLLREARWFK